MYQKLKYPPLFTWSCVIFILSSRPSTTLSESADMNTALFKSAHVAAYAILYVCAYIAFTKKKRDSFNVHIRALAYCICFAFSDEIHQLFVPTRTGKVSDMLIDMFGITCAYFFIRTTKLHKIKR